MKLPHSSMDYMMDDLSMEKDPNAASTDSVSPSDHERHNTYLQLTPSTSSSQPSTTQRQRRSTVSVACERCRKRKTKCSGLPGPCTNCARLNVPCYEPGRRKTTVQSTLEDRMQRLRALSAANRLGSQERQMSMVEGQAPYNQLTTDPRQLPNASAQAAFNPGLYELNAPSPVSAHSSEGWNAAINPASYFDSRLQETLDWTMSDFSDDNTGGVPRRLDLDSGLGQLYSQRSGSHDVLGGSRDPLQFSENLDMPIRATASGMFKAESPEQARLQTPIGFTISYDPAYFDDSELKPSDSNPVSPSSMDPEAKAGEDIEFDDNRRHSKQVSPAPYESSKSSPIASVKPLPPPIDSTTDDGGYTGYQLTRSQTVPTSHSANPDHQHQLEQETGLIELILRSSDTQRYIGVFFASVHKEFAFLNPTTFGDRRYMIDQLSNFNYNLIQQQNMMHFQALLVAAIGVLVQHKSTNLSSQYVRQATSIQDQFEMWNSVGGIHCAVLLALYCYLAQIMVYDTRQDESAEAQHSTSGGRSSRYPVSNLWLHNCQIAAACIDLGMHQPLAMQEQIRSKTDIKGYLETCRNTIRSAYVLDRKISELRNRPRAFHDADFDQTLIVDIR